ncbi:hypothetical protein [Sodalis sp.]|uniref:hypothetical protein n=1 Tax=Sodalis sp. (in: enterobacteria) TaxID=1898979 RepID=UPI003872A9FA
MKPPCRAKHAENKGASLDNMMTMILTDDFRYIREQPGKFATPQPARPLELHYF